MLNAKQNTQKHTHKYGHTHTLGRCTDEKRTHAHIFTSTHLHMHIQDYSESVPVHQAELLHTTALRLVHITAALQCVSPSQAAFFVLAALLCLKSDLSSVINSSWITAVFSPDAHLSSLNRKMFFLMLWQMGITIYIILYCISLKQKLLCFTKSHSKLPLTETGLFKALSIIYYPLSLMTIFSSIQT